MLVMKVRHFGESLVVYFCDSHSPSHNTFNSPNDPKTSLINITRLGTAAAYGWWYGYHVPKMRHQQNVYAKINAARAEQES
ncbi:hypothetical protein KEM48_011525 [Puccinia striiformis f. sp. tritici PST-130]|nr:hypothetical protein H4Q26_012093 [Puccinia striiformis f. sp. tritici PST-130]KAI9628569.1 hypothetical protein KEM48_011525 [Puccinia striiformis f. sp. tritici PST-130]